MQILVLVLGVVLMAGLQLLVNRTRLGMQMRAVAADREAAEMLGINVNFVITATFFLGSALAGVAGIMGGLLFNQVTSTIGFIVGLKAFTAAVVGGIEQYAEPVDDNTDVLLSESFAVISRRCSRSHLLLVGEPRWRCWSIASSRWLDQGGCRRSSSRFTFFSRNVGFSHRRRRDQPRAGRANAQGGLRIRLHRCDHRSRFDHRLFTGAAKHHRRR